MSERPSGQSPSSYAEAGVDLHAGVAATEAIKGHLARTGRPEVIDDAGGFAGLFAFDAGRYQQPVLVSAADGVGTKTELARTLGRDDTVGVDAVAMVVDDLVVSGAEPLFFLDYLAVGRLDPDQVTRLVAGIADGCAQAGCALLGGETAEHPGVLADDRYDVAGFGVGVVERAQLLGPERVQAGDAVVAMASSGLHANGYSLARRLVADLDLTAGHGLADQTLGEALLQPTRIYAPDCLALAEAVETHALCHVTGGAIPGNLPRVLPASLGAVVRPDTFHVPPVFRLLQQLGGVDEAEMWRVFNMGAGMLAVVADGEAACEVLGRRGVHAWVCGEITDRPGVELAGLDG